MCRKILAIALMLMLCFAACAEEAILPFGEALTFETQITADGRARLSADEADYATLSFTLQIEDNRGPMHFKKYYGDSYQLSGKEAVLEISLRLNDYEGEAAINPNRIILLTLQDENGETAKGYQMTNWEMDGTNVIPMNANLPISVFKRYDYDEDAPFNMRYLVVHSFNDGVEETYLMDMVDPDGKNTFTIVYDELKRKSRGKAVKELQTRLKELGLLTGSSVDGVYGPNTAESVKAAQKLLGFEETGVATHEFQKALYKYVPEPEEEPAEETQAPAE